MMAGPGPGLYDKLLDAARMQIIVDALRETRGNVTRAAVVLGVKRESLYKLCRRLQIEPRRFRG